MTSKIRIHRLAMAVNYDDDDEGEQWRVARSGEDNAEQQRLYGGRDGEAGSTRELADRAMKRICRITQRHYPRKDGQHHSSRRASSPRRGRGQRPDEYVVSRTITRPSRPMTRCRDVYGGKVSVDNERRLMYPGAFNGSVLVEWLPSVSICPPQSQLLRGRTSSDGGVAGGVAATTSCDDS